MFRLKGSRQHPFAAFVAALCIGPALAIGAPPLGPQEPPLEWLQPWSPPKAPEDYRSPGDLHKILVDSRDATQLAAVRGIDSLVVFPAQQRRLYLVSSEALNALPAAQRQKIRVRDDLNLIRLRDRYFDTTVCQPAIPDRLTLTPRPGPQLHLVQFSAPVQDEWVARLRDIDGLEVITYIPGNAYLVWEDQTARNTLAERADILPEVQWQGAFHPAYKLHPAFDRDFEGNVLARVQLFTHPGVDESIGIIRTMSSRVLSEPRLVGLFTCQVPED